MKQVWTAEQLISIEKEIADTYNNGGIRAPVHLSGGNEQQLIDIFKDVNEDDWVCSTWRSHYHCLLKGVPPTDLLRDVYDGRSITLCYPEQRVITSAIVGGIIPIGLGISLGIKRQGGTNKVWCFVGDMTRQSGIFHESVEYAQGFDLPIHFIVEDNKKSVGTPTLTAWGDLDTWTAETKWEWYEYDLPWPHSGAGKWVEF